MDKELEKKLSLYAKAHMAYYGELFTIKKSTYKKIIKIIAEGCFDNHEFTRKYHQKHVVHYFSREDTDSLRDYALAFHDYLSNETLWCMFKKNFQHSPIEKGLQGYLEVKKELKKRGLKPNFQAREIERNKYLTIE